MVKHQRRRRTQRRRQQKGGASCAALPMNRQVFAQSGGMAEMGPAFNGLLLDHATQVQAQVAPTVAAFDELPSVIPKMTGGARRKTRSARRKSRKARKSQKKERKSQKKQHKKSQRRQRGGGMSAFNAPYLLLSQSQYASDATNPQFQTEGSVNPLYSEFGGAQHA